MCVQLVPEASVVSGSGDSTPSPISGGFTYAVDDVDDDVDGGGDHDDVNDDHDDNENDNFDK